MLLPKIVTPKEEGRLKDGVKKIHSSTTEELRATNALELQQTLHSQKDTFPHPSLIRCLINIPLTSTLVSHLSNTVLSQFQVLSMTLFFYIFHYDKNFLTAI